MIAYFPEIYPDELVYSLLARYYLKAGYPCYWYVAEELFKRKNARPDIVFINTYTPIALKMITKDISMEAIIQRHTMFPYYGRFLSKERRNKALQAFVNMQGNYNNLLVIPQNKNGKSRYLRYCPICAERDRKQYGETYWHRIHQMQGVNICSLHRCNLIDSEVVISGKVSPDFVTAESVVSIDTDVSMCENSVECQLAEYIMNVFEADIDFQSDVLIGDFLHSRMGGTKYLSIRGKKRNIALFHVDFTEYYTMLSHNQFTELWQIQKVLNNYRLNIHEICMIAMFLGISATDLVNMKLPEKSQEQIFDEKIVLLHEQGLSYPEIAERLNASLNTVKPIGEKRYGKYKKVPKKPLKCGAKGKNWEKIDADTLPLVKDAIRTLQGAGGSRPKKISIYVVEKMLNLPSKRISQYLPRCAAEVQKNQETQEQYWAREVVWAVQLIIREGQPLNRTRIEQLTNMRKIDFLACIPYLDQYAEQRLVLNIKKLAV